MSSAIEAQSLLPAHATAKSTPRREARMTFTCEDTSRVAGGRFAVVAFEAPSACVPDTSLVAEATASANAAANDSVVPFLNGTFAYTSTTFPCDDDHA